MALRMALKRSTIFKRFMYSQSGYNLSAPLTTRTFSSTIPITDSNEDICTVNYSGGSFIRTDQFSTQKGMLNPNMENPFQISGPTGAFEAKKVEEGLYVRMEMAGIEKDDVKIWVEYGNIYVKGQGKKESNYEDSGREYNASLEISSNSFQMNQISAEMKNGVLRMLIPKQMEFQEMMRSKNENMNSVSSSSGFTLKDIKINKDFIRVY